LCLRRNGFRVEVFELGVPVGMLRTFIGLAIGPPREPSFTNSSRAVSALIGSPIRVSVAASFSMLFDTQIKGRMGSPSIAGSTRRSSAGTSPGSFAQSARRPPSARRDRPFGSGSTSRSSSPRLIFERASPVILETIASPPQTAVRTSPRRKQSSPPLVELRANRFPSLPNGVLVDHVTEIRLFAARRNPKARVTHAPYCDSVIVRGAPSVNVRPEA
jgi:hypothetical protein